MTLTARYARHLPVIVAVKLQKGERFVTRSIETWSYERKHRRDQSGERWHFARRSTHDPSIPYEDRPYELYFRNDDRTEFGLLRFARLKDNPYRDYEMVVMKIMNDRDFRRTLLAPETASVWLKSWK